MLQKIQISGSCWQDPCGLDLNAFACNSPSKWYLTHKPLATTRLGEGRHVACFHSDNVTSNSSSRDAILHTPKGVGFLAWL